MSNSSLLESPLGPTTFSTEAFDQFVMQTYGRFPIAFVQGKGCRLWDTEGKEYLDFVAGIATCTLGHAHPALVQAVTEQIQMLHHVSNLYYIPQQGDLAKWIVEHSCADHVFFCNSGAEANEAAIKLVRKYAHTVLDFLDLPIILTAKASFHGRVFGDAVIEEGNERESDATGAIVIHQQRDSQFGAGNEPLVSHQLVFPVATDGVHTTHCQLFHRQQRIVCQLPGEPRQKLNAPPGQLAQVLGLQQERNELGVGEIARQGFVVRGAQPVHALADRASHQKSVNFAAPGPVRVES